MLVSSLTSIGQMYYTKALKKFLFKAKHTDQYARKCRLYCVGAAKTGTHSIQAMFNETVRAGHEPDSRSLIKTIIAHEKGLITPDKFANYLIKRDAKNCLDVDSSQLNFYLISFLLRQYDDALFLLTIRDCYSWLDSIINDTLRRRTSKYWLKMRDLRFERPDSFYSSEESVLKDNRLYTLDGYLAYWSIHNNTVLSQVPPTKLMTVKTTEISSHACAIADYSGIPRSALVIARSHAFKNPVKYNILRRMDKSFLEAKVQEHCAPLMQRFFPDVDSASILDV